MSAVDRQLRVVRTMEAASEAIRAVTVNGLGIEKDTCVLHTRIAMTALQEMGLRAAAFPVRLQIGNPRWTELLEERGGWPETEAEQNEWADLGAYLVAIGYSDPERVRPDRWNGHLVVAVEGRYLLDLTLDQCDRPERGIVMPETFCLDARPLIQGRVPSGGAVINDCIVEYVPMRGDRSYMEESWHQWMRPQFAADRRRLRSVVERKLREDPAAEEERAAIAVLRERGLV